MVFRNQKEKAFVSIFKVRVAVGNEMKPSGTGGARWGVGHSIRAWST